MRTAGAALSSGDCTGCPTSLQESRHRVNGYFELSDEYIPRVDWCFGERLGMEPGVRTGNDHDGIFAGRIDDDHCGARGCVHFRHMKPDTVFGQVRPQVRGEGVFAQAADHGGGCAELCRGHRLVGALAARKPGEGLPGQRLAGTRYGLCRGHQVHVDRAGDDYPGGHRSKIPLLRHVAGSGRLQVVSHSNCCGLRPALG